MGDYRRGRLDRLDPDLVARTAVSRAWALVLVFAAAAAVSAGPRSGAEPGRNGTVPSGLRPAAASISGARVTGPVSGQIFDKPLSAFGAAADEQGRIWVAVANRAGNLTIYRGDREGSGWVELYHFPNALEVRQIEVVAGPGDSAAVFVFVLTRGNAGELRALRLDPADTLPVLEFDVAVGQDTITSFAVAADRDRWYYLYCLYANETRGGRNAGFTRSLDFGKSWEVPQGWWNCWAPALAYGSGSTVHAAWRYAENGREIHVQTSRYYGRPRSWWSHRRVSPVGELVTEPTIAQLDTAYDARGAAWVAWTVADRYDRRRRVEFARSDDGGGGWWHVGPPAGEPHLDRWAPMLAAAPGRPYGPVQLGYVAGRVGPDTSDTMPDKTTLRWRATTRTNPANWSAPAGAGLGPVASGPGVKPRLVIPPGAERGRPVFIYTRRSPDGASGLYAARGGLEWWSGAEADGPPDGGASGWLVVGRTLRLAAATEGAARVELFDAAGRRIGRPLAVGPGQDEVELTVSLPAGPVFVRLVDDRGARVARVVVVR